jgi:hypothetical protein
MIPNDFYGKKPFIWWTGVVEGVKDPLNLGSLQVRIIGLHSLDKTQVPTESLPWAQVAKPTTGANTSSGPREGDWVFGFFQDSEQAQIPVVLGVFPGIESKQSQIVYQESVTREGASNKPVSSQVDRVLGQPTTVLIARGVVKGTLVNATNNDLAHVCDIGPEVTKAVTWIRAKFAYVVEIIRKAIRSLLLTLGFDPSGEGSFLVQKLKSLAREIKKITKYVSDFNTMALKLVKLAKQIRAMIDYILSLPEKLRKLLQDCLAQLYAALAKGFTDLLASPEGLEDGSLQELKDAYKEVQDASKELYNTALQTISIPGQVLNALLTPASSADIDAAGKELGTYIDSYTDTIATVKDGYTVTPTELDKTSTI